MAEDTGWTLPGSSPVVPVAKKPVVVSDTNSGWTLPITPQATINQEPVEPTLGQKLQGRGQAMVGHAQKALKSKNIDALGSAAKYLVNTTGEGAGGIGDILSSILKPVGKVTGKVTGAMDEIFTPGAKEKWEPRFGKIAQGLSNIEAKDPEGGELVRNLGNIAGVAPMGMGVKALPGLAKGAVKGTVQAIKAPIAEVAGVAGVKDAIQNRAMNVMHTVLRDTKKDRDDGFDAKWVLDRQLSGNLAQMKKNADAYHNELSLQLKDRMQGTGRTVDIADAWNKTMDNFKSVDQTFGQGKQIKNALKNMTKEVEGVIGQHGTDIDVVLANDLKRLAGKNGVWADSFDKKISAEAKVYEAFYRNMKKNIEQAAPEVKDINAEFHKLIPLERVIAKRTAVAERGEIIPLKSMLNVGLAAVSGSPIPLALEVSNRLGRSGGFAQKAFNLTNKVERDQAAKSIVDIPTLTKWIEKYEPNLSTTMQRPQSITNLTRPNVVTLGNGQAMMFETSPEIRKVSEILLAKAANKPIPASIRLDADLRKKGGQRPIPKEYYENVLKQEPAKAKYLPDLLKYLAGITTANAREAVPQQQEKK